MLTARMDWWLRAGTVGNLKIYAIGGCGDGTPSSAVATVEEYNPATNAWTIKHSMGEARCFAGGTARTVGLDKRVLVAGGEDSLGHLLATVEEYTTNTDSWVATWPMLAKRSRFALVESENAVRKIYAVGGYRVDVPSWTKVVEEFDASSWTERAPMPTARGHIAVAVVNGQILVAGGEMPAPA